MACHLILEFTRSTDLGTLDTTDALAGKDQFSPVLWSVSGSPGKVSTGENSRVVWAQSKSGGRVRASCGAQLIRPEAVCLLQP